MMGLVLPLLLAFGVSALMTAYMARGKVTDVPDHRSSHSIPTPTSGGVGIVIGALLALGSAALFFHDSLDTLFVAGVFGLGTLTAALGFWDDTRTLGPKLKFVILAAIALSAPLFTGVPSGLPLAPQTALSIPFALGWAGAALWVFVVVNLTNFMDGSNGLMGGVMAVSFIGLTSVSLLGGFISIAVISFAMVAAITGFLIFNYRNNALIFCGDVGALFIGVVFAMCALRLAGAPGLFKAAPLTLLYVGPVLFLPFLTDGLMTLLMRARKGEALLSSHRSHLYQKAIQAGASHIQVARVYIALSLLCAALAVGGVITGLGSYMAYLGGLSVVAIAVYLWAYKRLADT